MAREESGKKLRWNELGIAKECGISATVSSLGDIQKLDIMPFERDIQLVRRRLAWGGDLVFSPEMKGIQKSDNNLLSPKRKDEMDVDEKVRARFSELLATGGRLRQGNANGQVLGEGHRQDCVGWLAAAQNLVHLVVTNFANPYRMSVDKICSNNRGYCAHQPVGEVTVILQSLLEDIDAGLLASIEDQTRATVFDDFLDHAKEYARNKRTSEAGVIAGVVFEDTLRTICRNVGLEEKGQKLDSLIDALVKTGTLTQVKAKRAKVAAHVRTKATHAQWDEFELEDVNTTISFTEELILKYLEN